MAKLLFFSQKIIDSWNEGEKIHIEGTTLTLTAGPQGPTRFELEEAVRFVAVSGGGEDAHGLIGKIKTKTQLGEMGAEAYMNSVILGETPYDVETGYLGRGQAAPAAAPASAQAAPPPPAPKGEDEQLSNSQLAPEGAESDEDLLANFLLKNL